MTDTANDPEHTHFGFQNVPVGEKANRVRAVFDDVVDKYDLMNDFMSFGLHRLWKFITVAHAGLRPHHQVLDLAAGTADLGRLLAKRLRSTGTLTLADINQAMLSKGRDRMIDAGFGANVHYVQADAERLPFSEASFHLITLAFGLRNVTHQAQALASMQRCLKPGGCCLILEFSHPTVPGFSQLYDAYSFRIIPKIGQLITGSPESYQYLVESIRKHPDQETLKNTMLSVGFDKVKVHNFAAGVVALHQGFKY